jgi:cytochrome d ubiquinol oxidase subunit I
MDLDPIFLSRLQFAFTIGFHILFPTLTMGLALFLIYLEGQWLRTRDQFFLDSAKFWSRIFALSFGTGVVSGVVLSYEIGLNWGEFSRITGNVLGPVMSYEVLTAFFLEAGFLGIMLFGWNRVGAKLHYLATLLVALEIGRAHV